MPLRLHLLAGTAESLQIARALAREDRVIATASLGRPQRTPVQMGIPVRIGGWGGREGFADWLRREKVQAVLDATHPFANQITANAAEVCQEVGVSFIQFQRPAWTPGPGDTWTFLNTEAEAANHVPKGATVYLMTGLRGLDRFANLEGRRVYVRIREHTDRPFPFARGGYVLRPDPMPVERKTAFLHDMEIDWIVGRNSGGMASAGMLEAARQLGLPVAMIRRPPQPEVPRIHTVSEAIAWVRRRI